jgi:hypothetical protein
MEGQRKESLCRLSEQVLAVAANAITNAINTEAIAKAVDTEAITDAITAGLKEIRFKNETAMQASIIGEKIGESVASAVKAALAASEPKASMDATSMREQTLGTSSNLLFFPFMPTNRANSQHPSHLRPVHGSRVKRSVSDHTHHQIQQSRRRLLGFCSTSADQGLPNPNQRSSNHCRSH